MTPQTPLRRSQAGTGGGGNPTYDDCGTVTAYERHRRNGNPTCEPCRAANAKAKDQQGHTKARARAMWKLAAMPEHRDQFEQLAAAHGTDKRRRDKAVRELARLHPKQFQRLFTDEYVRLLLEEVAG